MARSSLSTFVVALLVAIGLPAAALTAAPAAALTAPAAALTAPASATSAAPATGAAGPADSSPYYLALGDSLAQGVQPNSAGQSVETNQGYADDLWGRYHATSPSLRLAKLGCPGETTTTMINGGICDYDLGSQLAQASSFLATHRVVLVTLDIGANNIDSCVSAAGLDQACLANGFAVAQHDLPVILQALRQAAPNVPMVAMTYYDPFVAAALKGGPFVALAIQSEQLGATFNQILVSAYRAYRVAIADVAGAFAPFSILPPNLTLSVNLALICAFTWMCAPAPVGPNIHATALGYSVIADVFGGKIG
jgi:lysophospholipase L1-like esterase